MISNQTHAVLQAIERSGMSTPLRIQLDTGLSGGRVSHILARALTLGLVQLVDRGVYALADQAREN